MPHTPRCARVVSTMALSSALAAGGLVAGAAGADAAQSSIPKAGGSATFRASGSVRDVETSALFTLSTRPSRGRVTELSTSARQAGTRSYRVVVRVGASGRARVLLRRTGPGARSSTPAKVRGKVKKRVAVRAEVRVTGTKTVSVLGRAWVKGAKKPGWQVRLTDRSAARVASGSVVNLVRAGRSPKRVKVKVSGVSVRRLGGTSRARGAALAAPSRVGTGSVRVGTAAYAVPRNAVVVSPRGNDRSTGSLGAPLRTIRAAVARARSGSTIVVRGGTYRERVTLPRDKRLVLQSYPREAVWLDGSQSVTGFTRYGKAWVRTGWTTQFDHSPTYKRGAADSSTPGWQWLNSSYPMAAHPDQVWINGAAQRQVGSLSGLRAGTFFVDDRTDRLYLGSAPTGRTVEASTINKALIVTSPGSVVRGIGVRRYAPSVPDMGAVYVSDTARGSVMENVTIQDNATTGLSVNATGVRMNAVSSSRNGFLGIHAVYVDGLRANNLLVQGNNTERFNPSPAAGGFKITRSRGVAVSSSRFVANIGNGLWFDESCRGITVTSNRMEGNVRTGLHLELSAAATVTNNVINGNAYAGLVLQNVTGAQVWNNTLARNQLTIWITQDARRAANAATAGHDPRHGVDPSVPWITRDIRVVNNVLSDPRGSDVWCGLLCAQDQTKRATAAQMRVTASGNVYHRRSSASPRTVVRWAAGSGGMKSYPSVASFRRATGLESGGQDRIGQSVSGGAPANGRAVMGAASQGAVALPASIARISGQAPGSRFVGARLS